MREFGEILKDLRTKRGYSQQELADKLHVSKAMIGHYEHGKRNPSRQVLEDMADLFNVDTDYLLGREERSTYYLDPAVADMAQQAYDDPDTRLLLDAKRDLSEEDLDTVVSLIKRLKKDSEQGGDF